MGALEVDVVVIGMGPGGEHVAQRLARAGLRVLGVDRRLVGGECPYFACVPTKMMVRAADTLSEARKVPALAGAATVRSDWTPVAERIRNEATANWDDEAAVRRFTDAGGTFRRGHGRITGPGAVTVTTVDGERVEVSAARGIVLNTGTDPAVPGLPGLAGTPFWTNRDVVRVEQAPNSLVVLGGGPVGVELAQVFSRFGAQVSVVQHGPRLLPNDEPEASELLAELLTAEGLSVHTGVAATAVEYDGAQFTLALDSGARLTAQHLLVATGRRTDFAKLGIAAVGLDESARAIEVDDRLRAAPGVWAVGDITGKGAFTHMSMYQAEIVARDILGEPGPPADYRAVPRVTFTDPEVGSVGLTEAAARAKGLRVGIGQSKVESSTRGFIHGAGNRGLIKLVADLDRGVLVGATSMGPAGGEVLGALAVAVHGEVPVDRLRELIFAYPTFHRAIGDAIADLG